MKKITLFFILLICNFMACAQTSQVDQPQLQTFSPVYIPQLPDKLDLAGEEVPLGNYDTRESLLREMMTTVYLHSRTMQTIIASTRYFPIIEPIMKKYGIPDDFKYLCMAESGLDPNAGSSAGASGLWQLMPAFGKSQGLIMGGGVDERFHIEKSTEAACMYLLDAKKRLGSWTLAAASYNVGVAGTSKRLEQQGVTSYYDLFMPEETMRYVFRVLTFKLLMQNPEAYGFIIGKDDYQKPLTDYREETVSGTTIDWSAAARKYGTNYKMLRQLNHWIRDYTYSNKAGHTFVIKVPKEGFRN